MERLTQAVAKAEGIVVHLASVARDMDAVKEALRNAYKIAEDQMEGEYVGDVKAEITTAFDLLFDDYIYDDTQSGGS